MHLFFAEASFPSFFGALRSVQFGHLSVTQTSPRRAYVCATTRRTAKVINMKVCVSCGGISWPMVGMERPDGERVLCATWPKIGRYSFAQQDAPGASETPAVPRSYSGTPCSKPLEWCTAGQSPSRLRITDATDCRRTHARRQDGVSPDVLCSKPQLGVELGKLPFAFTAVAVTDFRNRNARRQFGG